MAANAYGQERLERLLRLLAPAPGHWVENAQEAVRALLAREKLVGSLTAADVAELQRAIERDASFRAAFEVDPVGAAEAAGWSDVARALQRELRALVAFAERITADEAYGETLSADPAATVEAAGLPVDAAEAFLRTVAVGDDVLARLPEVVAHGQRDSLRSRLIVLLLESRTVVETLRDVARGAR